MHSESPDERIASRRQRYLAFDLANRPYMRWQVAQFAPCLGRRVLEIGCGVGSVIDLIRPREAILGIDVVPDVLDIARERFSDDASVEVRLLDFTEATDADLDALRERRFDTLICINVLEHIDDDTAAVRRMSRLLDPGGTLALLVPAHQALYGEYDRLDGHFRRYSRRTLRELLERGGFTVESLRHFNLVGAMGWWVQYKLLRRKIHGESQFGLMNLVIPVMRPLEKLFPPPFGLSLVAICRRR